MLARMQEIVKTSNVDDAYEYAYDTTSNNNWKVSTFQLYLTEDEVQVAKLCEIPVNSTFIGLLNILFSPIPGNSYGNPIIALVPDEVVSTNTQWSEQELWFDYEYEEEGVNDVS